MKSKLLIWALMTVIGLMLVACRSDSDDVATLQGAGKPQAEASGVEDDSHALDDEAMMMALTECLRDHGVEVLDPVVDADGNVDKPELAEGVEWDKRAGQAWEACEHHLEGFTGWGKEESDAREQAEQLDQYIALATCLREKNYRLDDPSAETLGAWMGDFKKAIDWKDPAAVADYEACSGETIGKGTGK
jgi:hypothetical protein